MTSLGLKRVLRTALFQSLVLGVIATAASFWLVDNVPRLADAEGVQTDLLARHVAPIAPDPAIVVVLVNRDTPAALGKPRLAELPLPLTDFARAIKTLGKGEPSVLVCDLELGSVANNIDSEGQEALRGAVESIRGVQVVVPAGNVVDPEKGEPRKNPDALGGFDYRFIDPAFAQGLENVHVGHALSLRPDSIDIGVNPILTRFPTEEPIFHEALLAVLLHRKVAVNAIALDTELGSLTTGLGQWSLNPALGIDTLWARHWGDFQTFSLQRCLSMNEGELKKSLKNKIVVLGDIRPNIDETAHPAKFQEVPGVFFVVNTLNTLLSPAASWPHLAPEPIVWCGCFAIAFVSAYSLTIKQRLRKVLLPIVLFFAAASLPSIVAQFWSVYIDPLEPVLSSLIGAALMAATVVASTSWFESRVPGSLAESAVLFVDLEDSTGLTVTQGAATYQGAFTEFARRSAGIVQRSGGTVERTTGDGFIATFGYHGAEHPAARALEAAQLVAVAAAEIGESHGLNLLPSAGLEFGLVSGGYVIEAGRSVWSSSGKCVILAQRLLTIAATTESRIALGPVAAGLLHELTSVRSLGSRSLKGIEGETEVFTLMGVSHLSS